MNSQRTAAKQPIVTERLAEFVNGTRFEDLPSEVVEFSKRLMLDTLGVAWAGAGAAGCDVVHKLLKAQSGVSESSLWAFGDRMPAISAAFANSLFAAALDYDSFYQKGTLHSDIVVLPAGLATAEREDRPGKEFISSIATANEVVCRLGLSTQRRTGWFFTSVHGVFGAAAVTSRLMGGSAEQICNALGLAYLNAAGTQQPAVERSTSKRLGSAFAARSGVQAGQLAAAGFEGPRDVLNGRFGLYAMYEEGEPGEVTDRIGERFELLETTVKRYPSCACAHGATDAALHLVREDGLRPEMVENVEVMLSPYMARLVGAPFDPRGSLEVAAQFSVQYAIAVAIERQRFGLDDLAPDAVRNQSIGRLASLVRVTVDEANEGVMAPVTVTVRTRDGRDLAHTVSSIPGTPGHPLDESDFLDKFRTCTQSGPRALTEHQADALAERVLNIEHVTDMRGFFDGILRD